MDELFGAPVGSIIAVLGAIFALIVAFLIYINVRNPILVRMAFRNASRRPGQSLLIIMGLMLATAIISSAFTVGDSVTFSIKNTATESLRSLDEMVRVDEDSDVWEGMAVPDEFPEEVFLEVARLLENDPDIDGVLPVLFEDVAVINQRSKQFELGALLTGVDPARADGFEQLKDVAGNPVDLAALAANELYLDREGAETLQARPGDVLGVALGPGELTPMVVKGVVDGWYFKRANTDVVLMMSLGPAQDLLGLPGQLSAILISNRGDAFSGGALTGEIMGRYEELLSFTDEGLELFAVKREVIDQANEVGSIAVSFFTTFGLFSIGVGLLLIFLIFSMLAAERKGEMGMSRAVGMQRQHLVRMFTVEGAIYGIGSALVGASIGLGLGFVLVKAVAGIFSQDPTDNGFDLSPHVQPTSFLISFLAGSVLTLVTVLFASRRISRLNIVRAIRDIPEPSLARAGRGTLVWGLVITGLGLLVLTAGFQASHLTSFGLGVSLMPIGISFLLRWRGVAQRWVLTGTGMALLAFWLLPSGILDRIKDWNEDFSLFFVSGSLLVTGAVLVTVNNAPVVLTIVTNTLGRIRRLTPILKSAVSYPLRFGFRTGLSMAMFAIVIFSVTVMATLIEAFSNLFDDQQRLAGGYEVMAFARSDLNPVADLRAEVSADPELGFVARVDERPSVGTFRTVNQADARLAGMTELEFADTTLTGVDDDFIESNQYTFALATPEYTAGSEVDAPALWRALQANPGLAVVNAVIVPTRNDFGPGNPSDTFTLDGVPGLFIENDTMEPVGVTVRDLKSGGSLNLTVIGVLDNFASGGPVPLGLYTSSNTFAQGLQREVNATQFFFNIDGGAVNGAETIEAAFLEHGLETIDIKETIDELQESQRALFNLLIGFMMLGLVVGIAGLGVISARAVVERRHEIGVLRAIGFSRRMVQASFLAESSFIGLLGISLGLLLGLLTSINIINDIRADEPNVQFAIPWLKVLSIAVGAYLFSLLTTYIPAREAARIAPAEALRYE